MFYRKTITIGHTSRQQSLLHTLFNGKKISKYLYQAISRLYLPRYQRSQFYRRKLCNGHICTIVPYCLSRTSIHPLYLDQQQQE